MRLIPFILAIAFAIPAVALDVTLESLLGEMLDLSAQSRYPDPPFTCRQFSSYDRRSTDPEAATDENWFANGDRGKFIREEEGENGKEYVMMDAKGPGAIVRMWSADPQNAGVLRVYLDGAKQPAIEMPFDKLLKGETFPFVAGIAGTYANGCNAYFPIPYNKSCVVTASQPEFYYHINYRTYPDGVVVRTYSETVAKSYWDLIHEIGHILLAPGPGTAPEMPLETIAPQASYTTSLDGKTPQAITRIFCKADADNLDTALRAAFLTITFDGAKEAQISVPLGDFFGTAPGNRPYEGLPMGVLREGTFYAQWVMPFRSHADIRVYNAGDGPFSVGFAFETTDYEWKPDSLYFHAKWRGEKAIPTRPRRDWNFAELAGHGRYVGCMLHIVNPTAAWWGEGDEKIYVDGETFPSHFGTGTEDYFGYAWSSPELFTHAYHNQTRCDGPSTFGNDSVNRFHILDVIPFDFAFKFDMGVWHWEDVSVDMAATTYWYAAPGCRDNFRRPTADDLVLPPMPKWPTGVEGALEGETLEAEASAGTLIDQFSTSWPWSAKAQLWWSDAAPGNTLTVHLPVGKAGSYNVYAVFTTANDYGQFTMTLGDRALGKTFDFYNADVVPTKRQTLGTFELPAGDVPLVVTVTGANEKAIKRYMFGLDYVLLEPAGTP